MYSPRQIGIPNFARTAVAYHEFPAPKELENVVYCTWELRTTARLEQNCKYFILPDACGDIIFDMHDSNIDSAVFMMISGIDAEEANLGKDFRYYGIRMLPGVLHTETTLYSMRTAATWKALYSERDMQARQRLLAQYTGQLLDNGAIRENYLMRQILTRSEMLHKVGDIEALTGYTRRQLQRIIMQQTGFTPRDFLKVLRFQQALTEQQHHYYTDQSHYIREFKRTTGVTPKKFRIKY